MGVRGFFENEALHSELCGKKLQNTRSHDDCAFLSSLPGFLSKKAAFPLFGLRFA
jgi:hypothetical protein